MSTTIRRTLKALTTTVMATVAMTGCGATGDQDTPTAPKPTASATHTPAAPTTAPTSTSPEAKNPTNAESGSDAITETFGDDYDATSVRTYINDVVAPRLVANPQVYIGHTPGPANKQEPYGVKKAVGSLAYSDSATRNAAVAQADRYAVGPFAADAGRPSVAPYAALTDRVFVDTRVVTAGDTHTLTVEAKFVARFQVFYTKNSDEGTSRDGTVYSTTFALRYTLNLVPNTNADDTESPWRIFGMDNDDSTSSAVDQVVDQAVVKAGN